MFQLPVSGLEIALRQPAGAEDLLLQESPVSTTALALALVARLACLADGTAYDWSALSVTDLEVLLLLTRQNVFGDRIQADILCTVRDCGARVDISFSIADYLAHHVPRLPKELELADEPGWFQIPEQEVKFRLPTGADQAVVAGQPKPERELMRRCAQPADISVQLRKRVESAMEALAPCLSHEVCGECPACHTVMGIYFDVQGYVLRELRDQAAFVYEDVHLLAAHYQWSEESILALPRSRRLRYAALLRQAGDVV